MGKTFLGIFSTLIAISVGTTTPLATVPAEQRNYVNEKCLNGQNYVDEDNDGICDNYTDGQSRGYGCGRNFVDADNDGVCDNYTNGQGRGCGRGHGNGFRGGCGR